MTVITRFAPSPTGYLHVGSARTALFCYLWARKQKGKFILRIEDTDLERSTPEAVEVIIEGLKWLGLHWDEGPIFQTQRFDRYKTVIKQLLNEGKAYKCYCSKDRLEVLREQQLKEKQKPRYDGYCLKYPTPVHADAPFVVRFKTPQTGTIAFDDLVKGHIEIHNSELDDLIIARTDGTPTYNFTVVIDDWDMGVTQVLRGDDHINNTPRQIHIFKALGATPPEYGHMPMLLGEDGKRLSKRHGAVSVLQYRDEGILPKALINYLVRLGWSYGDKEIFSMQEMVDLFDVHHINVAPTALNPGKLLWLNQHYLKTEPPEQIALLLNDYLVKIGVDIANGPGLIDVVVAMRDRAKTLVEMAEKSRFLYVNEVEMNGDLASKHFNPEAITAIEKLIGLLKNLEHWTPEALHTVVNNLITELNIKLALLAQPIRLAVTGTTMSPSLDVTLFLLGKEKTLKRLQEALEQMKGLT